MTRVCYTHRGRGLAHPAPLTRALLPRAANCLDCERLLSLAFDKFSFLRSFPQARVDTLRRKHHARLLAAEEAYEETRPSPSRAGSAQAGGGASPSRVPGDGSSGAMRARHPSLPVEDLEEDNSSDEEGGEHEPDPGEYDVISFDDLVTPARSFWL